MRRAALLAGLLLGACIWHDDDSRNVTVGGDAEVGKALIAKYGCGSCHLIPGVRGANSYVGPPLIGIASRMYIAGVIPNDPENMVRWIMNPQSVEPHTAMPNLGVREREARDIAEYLYRLKAPGE